MTKNCAGENSGRRRRSATGDHIPAHTLAAAIGTQQPRAKVAPDTGRSCRIDAPKPLCPLTQLIPRLRILRIGRIQRTGRIKGLLRIKGPAAPHLNAAL